MKHIKTTNNYVIKSLGIRKETVYDIEVEGNHNFFANDILIHNSFYFELKDLVKKFKVGDYHKDIDMIDKICKGIEKNVIQPCFERLYNNLNCYMPQMFMDREVIASKAFWTGKKHYAMSVLDNEGIRYDKPKLKIMGLTMVQSRTPETMRDKLTKAVDIILNESAEDRIANYIKKTKKEFYDLPIEDISFNVKVGNLPKYMIDEEPYYKKGTQAQLRASILHNVLANDIPHLNDITPGDTVKWTNLVIPNPSGNDVIAFDTFMPEEFKLNDYVDYNVQFEKTFKSPLTDICDKIGIAHENITNIDSFFS